MQAAGYQMFSQTVASDLLEKILSRKCKIHPQFSCQYVHLKPSQFSPRLCIQCMEDRNIPLNEALSIQILLQGTCNTTFNTYPQFSDSSIIQKIKDLKTSDDSISTDISSFFNNLHAAVSQAIEKAKSASKQNLASLSNSYQGLFNSLGQISQIENFQEFVKNQNQNDAKLKRFIQEQHSSMNKHTEEINKKLMEYQKIKQSFSLTDANNKLNQIIKLIEEITLFPTIANNSQQQQQQNLLQLPIQNPPQQQQQIQQQKPQQQLSSSQSDYDYQKSLIKQCKEKYQLQYEKQSKFLTQSQALWLQYLKEEALKKLQEYQCTYKQWQTLSEEQKQDNLSYLEKELGTSK